jgi:hypothetical protein
VSAADDIVRQTRTRPRIRTWTWGTFAVSALIAAIVLAVLGLQPLTVREFALDAPNQGQVALLKPGHQVCEGPITTPAPIQGVGIWGGAVVGSSQITATIEDASTHRPLATGTITAAGPSELRKLLSATVPPGRAVRVCLRGRSGQFSLLGSAAVDPAVVLHGGVAGSEFSLVLLRRSGQSLLGSLPLAFGRAALWRPSWVGSWTFWVFAGLLLSTILLGSIAIASAARADERPRPQAPDGADARD